MVSLFLTYFTCIIDSSFIHLIRIDSNAFFLIAEHYSIVYMYHSFLIHLSANGHLGCFHVLAIVNSAVMNNGVHVSLSILVSSVYMPAVGLLGCMVVLSPGFKGISTLFSIVFLLFWWTKLKVWISLAKSRLQFWFCRLCVITSSVQNHVLQKYVEYLKC